jgi:hypothetical protein
MGQDEITSFQPEALERMHRVFEAVCATLLLSPAVDDQVTKLVASRVVALARAGETDANRMITLVLAEFLEPRGGPQRQFASQPNLGSLPPQAGTYDPATLRLLRAALDAAWDALTPEEQSRTSKTM